MFLQVKSLSGVKIVSYCSPLYFANADIFRRKVIKKVLQTGTNCVSSVFVQGSYIYHI